MGELVEILTPLHTRTTRDYFARMADDKVACSDIARQYERDYWDGDRRHGYGGYRYDGRWEPVARTLVDRYGLTNDSRVVDVGCGKAHLLYEIHQLLPGAEIVGFDISEHGLADAPEPIRERLSLHRAEDPYPFDDAHFDLVISLMTLHNLPLPPLDTALREIQRVSRQGYIAVESYRSTQELFNLQCWALTCESFLRPEEWTWMFAQAGYTGDYEFAYFE